jgi:mannan endo-1,4-beta-mannosidase
MREAQAALSAFLPLIDWASFRRTCLNSRIRSSAAEVACFGCGDEVQAVLWLLRKDRVGQDGMLQRGADLVSLTVEIPGLAPGRYRVTQWDTVEGCCRGEYEVEVRSEPAHCMPVPPFASDLALAVARR